MSEGKVLEFLEKLDNKMNAVAGSTEALRIGQENMQKEQKEIKQDIDKLFIKIDSTSTETTINSEAIKFASMQREQLKIECESKLKESEERLCKALEHQEVESKEAEKRLFAYVRTQDNLVEKKIKLWFYGGVGALAITIITLIVKALIAA